MRFRKYDTLRLFDVVARHLSFTVAAENLNLTKGAVSYQMARLESELGFQVFVRQNRGVALTEKGQRLWQASRTLFLDFEREIASLCEDEAARITIGMSTYFASRWLSPQLMNFTAAHSDTALRLQPMVNMSDLHGNGVDMAIRWGKGDWADLETECLFPCPVMAMAGTAVYRQIEAMELEKVLPGLTLLHDRDGSETWGDWHTAARLPYRPSQDSLIIPDPERAGAGGNRRPGPSAV